ncbi:MAG TPA: hypothetical protein VKT32_08675 [Chthonomonadaceae bacterium]|nr:hypothetical protein [Chthonomonadaceae bacterium]
MEPLEQAHLALIRGDLEEARQLVEGVLEKEPDNLPAMKLFNKVRSQQARIRAEQIEDESRVQARTNWLNTFDPSTAQVYLMLIGASILVGVGFCLAINPFILGLRHGFSYQVVKPTFLGDGHYPVHFLLVGPLIMFGLGVFLLYSLFRYLWWD